MSKELNKKSITKNYAFLAVMLAAMVLGCIAGWLFPAAVDGDGGVISGTGATVLKPLGMVFINMMFCIVVPMVFASISSAVANMESRQRAGKIMGVTVATFVVTGAIAAVIMYLLMRLFPPVLVPWTEIPAEEVGEHATMAQMVVNFFTAEDFVSLLSRRAMLPLIVFSLLFGFFGIFADLVATYGPQITANYGRALLVYYPLCLVYVFTAFPLFAWFGGGRQGPRVMLRHIAKPAIVSLGTCSSVATIPANMEEAADTGISRDVSDMVLPLGATMHMDGSCFSCVLKIAFVLGVFGVPFEGVGMLVKVVLVAVLSSVGMSGVPGGGYIGEYIICSIFFPNQMELAYPILVAIGNLVDPPATMINAAGDYVVSFIVSRFVDGKDWLDKALRARRG